MEDNNSFFDKSKEQMVLFELRLQRIEEENKNNLNNNKRMMDKVERMLQENEKKMEKLKECFKKMKKR